MQFVMEEREGDDGDENTILKKVAYNGNDTIIFIVFDTCIVDHRQVGFLPIYG